MVINQLKVVLSTKLEKENLLREIPKLFRVRFFLESYATPVIIRIC